MTYTYLIPQIPTDKDHIQVGAENLAIKLQINDGYSPMDLSGSPSMTMIIQKPDSTLVTGSATLYSSASLGIIMYRTSASDLDQSGEYEVQAYIDLGSFKGYTTPVQFKVWPNLPITDEQEDEMFP